MRRAISSPITVPGHAGWRVTFGHGTGSQHGGFANIFAGITIAVALLLFGGHQRHRYASPGGFVEWLGLAPLNLMIMVWQTGRFNKLLWLITFVFTLLIPLQYAVLVGVALAITSVRCRPVEQDHHRSVPIERDPPEVLEPNTVTILVPFGSLFFAAATIFEETEVRRYPTTQSSSSVCTQD